MRGARASSAGLQPLAGTLAMSPERKVAPMNSPLAGSPHILGLVSMMNAGRPHSKKTPSRRGIFRQLQRGKDLETHKGFK